MSVYVCPPPPLLFPSVNSSSIFGCEFVANAKELIHRLIYIHVQPSVVWRVCQRQRFVVKLNSNFSIKQSELMIMMWGGCGGGWHYNQLIILKTWNLIKTVEGKKHEKTHKSFEVGRFRWKKCFFEGRWQLILVWFAIQRVGWINKVGQVGFHCDFDSEGE